MRYIYVNFNDVYLCVQALLTKNVAKTLCTTVCIVIYVLHYIDGEKRRKKNGKPEILYTDNRIHTPLDCGVAEQRI